MELNIERLVLLLLVAAAVSMLGRKLRLPYTVGPVLTGVALVFSPLSLDIRLTKALIFTAFLPPLIFEAALQIPWRELRRDLLVILVLVTLGVLLASGVTATGMYWLVGWRWETALLLGVLLAATDPVSVIATFKEAGVEGRLRLLVEAESLFNDGTAAVLFGRGAGGNQRGQTECPATSRKVSASLFSAVYFAGDWWEAGRCGWQDVPTTIWSRLLLP